MIPIKKSIRHFVLFMLSGFCACTSHDPFHYISPTGSLLDGGSAVAKLDLSSTSIDFGPRSVNSVNVIAVQLTNSGKASATNFSVTGYQNPIAFYDGDLSNGSNACGSVVAAGASCMIRITFLPKSLSQISQSLSIQYYDGKNEQTGSLNVSGSGSNVVELQLLDPNNLFSNVTAFPVLVAGSQAASYTFLVKYAGDPSSGAVGVTFNTLPSPFSISSTTCQNEQHSDCEVTVNCASAKLGSSSQPLTVTYDNYAQSASSTQTITEQTIQGNVVIENDDGSPANGNFGKRLIGHSFTKLFKVINKGMTAASSLSPAVSGTSFALNSTTCQNNLPPGSECSVSVQFNTNAQATTPATAQVSGAFSLSYSNGISMQSATPVALSGSSGNHASLTILDSGSNPGADPFNMGSYSVGYPHQVTFTLQNDPLSVAATVNSLSLSTPQFTLNARQCGNVASGANCRFTVTFTPDSANGLQNKTFTDSIEAVYSDSDSSLSPPTLTTTRHLEGVGEPDALLVFSPIPPFNQAVGTSVTQTVIVHKYGTLAASSVSATGLSGFFSYNGFSGNAGTCAGTVPATCQIAITYSPTSVETGDLQTLTATYGNGLGGAGIPAVLNVVGNAYLPTAELLFNDSSPFNFGNIAQGTPKTHTFLMTVQGTASHVNVTSVSSSSAPFQLQNNTCSGTVTSPGGCSLSITVNLANPGIYTGTVTVAYFNGLGNKTVQMNLNASNLAALSLSGNSFGNTPVGTPIQQTFLLKNVGLASATSVLECPSGLAAPYTITSNQCPSSLAPSQSCNLTVQFLPAGPGLKQASLCFAYNKGDGTTIQIARSLSAGGTVPAILQAGGNQTFYLNPLGKLFGAGDNSRGQLGQGDLMNRDQIASPIPLSLSNDEWAIQLAVGGHHVCVRSNKGRLFCLGANESGQLGIGNNTGNYSSIGDQPNEVAQLSAVNLGTGKTASYVAAGYAHTCAIRNDGSVVCFGNNNMGQLGIGSTDNIGGAANQVGDNFVAVPLPGPAVSLSLDTGHSIALLQDGSVFAWGDNQYGQLGQGSPLLQIGTKAGQINSLSPVKLPSNRVANAIAAGGAFSIALDNVGQIEAFGHNLKAVLGVEWCSDGVSRYGSCSDPSYPVAIDGYGDHPEQMGDALVPVNLGASVKALQLAPGNNFNCALTKDSSGTAGVKCWGDNSSGQLGNGTTNDVDPSQLGNNFPSIDLGNVPVSVTSGDSHACALLSDGSVRCWGDNQYGQLGSGNTQAQSNPIKVTLP